MSKVREIITGACEFAECDLLNEDKITAFGEKYDILPEEVKEEVLKALSEIKKDKDYTLYCKLLLGYMKNNMSVKPLEPDFEDGIKAEFALFFPVWYMAEEAAADMERRGIPHNIIAKSFKGISGCVAGNKKFKGCMGTSAYFTWLTFFAGGKLFRLNDFQYEKREHNGRPAIGIHIPAGTKLNVYQNILSFREALDFFETYYPEIEISGFTCESWLLSREIEEVMGKKTNISRFGDMFDHYSINDTQGDAVYRFVYNLVAPYPPLEELPENTTLQRKLKEYMIKGKKAYALGGFISKEKLISMLNTEKEGI